MPSTFIKIDRNLLQWRWFQDSNTLQLWIYLLASVNIKDHDFMNITVHRGELATSYPSLSAATGQTVKEIRTALEHLKATGEVAVTRHPKFSVISVLNYDLYQGVGQSKGSQKAGCGQSKGNNIRMEECKNKRTLSKDSVCDKGTRPRGKFKNVFLTDDEYEEYRQIYSDIDTIIDELSASIETQPNRYGKGHPTAWLDKFIAQKQKTAPAPKGAKKLKWHTPPNSNAP